MSKIIELITTKINKHQCDIADFFNQKFNNKFLNFYNSVDLRHCGYKIASVDTNCFPAGFNNLDNSDIEIAKKYVQDFFKQNFSKPISKIILIPENHTRNLKYLENIARLQEILSSYAITKIGSLNEEIIKPTDFVLENQQTITLYPLQLQDKRISTIDGFVADLIILNNDLTAEIPQILKNTITPIFPSTKLGWYQRSKSQHFKLHDQLVSEFCKIIDLDPWLISAYHDVCNGVDFKKQINLECVANHVEGILQKTQKKYDEYGINDKPYAFVKADNGTYGMAVWSVSSGAEVLEINKKERNKMSVIKGTVENHKVLIQEGIKTIDKINSQPCEPLIYLINSQIVGNIFRANSNRNETNSLNSVGASFYNINQTNFINNFNDSNKNLVAVYEILAKLSSYTSYLENFIYE
jgi:glutamate--cysteine ligase